MREQNETPSKYTETNISPNLSSLLSPSLGAKNSSDLVNCVRGQGYNYYNECCLIQARAKRREKTTNTNCKQTKFDHLKDSIFLSPVFNFGRSLFLKTSCIETSNVLILTPCCYEKNN